MKYFKFLLSLSLLSACSLLLPHSGLAHDANEYLEFGVVGGSARKEITHNDTGDKADDNNYKGWFNLTVTNTGTEAWGDFHFQIFSFPTNPGTVFFEKNIAYAPTSSQQSLSYNFSEDGRNLDLYFYADPIDAEETAWFRVYTDNTTHKLSFFGVGMYPTPVPVPNGAWLLLTGITAFAAMGRKTRA